MLAGYDEEFEDEALAALQAADVERRLRHRAETLCVRAVVLRRPRRPGHIPVAS
jgi:hypothetical protein